MPYDQILAERVRAILNNHPGCIEKKMFGGVGFILRGNMAVGVQGDDLIIRVGTNQNEMALSHPYVRQFEGAPGRPMAGWVRVSPEGVSTEADLLHWIMLGYENASTLPKKD